MKTMHAFVSIAYFVKQIAKDCVSRGKLSVRNINPNNGIEAGSLFGWLVGELFTPSY
jgi:hypothetical protein